MSKHALLIHAHPEPRSFVTAMRDTIAGELERAGTVVAHSDLYAMGYNPVLSRADFPVDQGEDPLVIALAQRRGYADGTLAPDIMLEIEKVLAADLLVFTFPIFWFSTPAILKGWIDRTFVSGPFYGGRRIYSEGGLKGKKAFVALSLGGRGHMFGDGGLHGPLQQGMLRHFLQGSLGYVGLEVLEPFIAWHVPYVSADDRKTMLDELAIATRGLDERASLPMPDLGAFDQTFAPLPQDPPTP